jgi:hypothetical protein
MDYFVTFFVRGNSTQVVSLNHAYQETNFTQNTGQNPFD